MNSSVGNWSRTGSWTHSLPHAEDGRHRSTPTYPVAPVDGDVDIMVGGVISDITVVKRPAIVGTRGDYPIHLSHTAGAATFTIFALYKVPGDKAVDGDQVLPDARRWH